MEFTKIEILVVQDAVASSEAQIKELGDLELALIGGGIGDTVHV
jgi:hypothetical protein